ncbi:PAS domain S-box protein [Dokdonella sp.]|uniref:PAS domain S-box protein n=1 Tax=Dokdonella sp. TaxID=2291710 RepID=UPI002F3F818E
MTRPAPLPPDEVRRLARLRALDALDTEAEPLFDALAQAAALVVGAPIALVSLVDERRQWFKANVGLEGTGETPRDVAFCAHAILGDELFVVPDAHADPRFADNPLVTADPNIRFYAGAPIRMSDGLRMGALCVMDRTPRELDANQAAILQQLARAVSEALEQRAAELELNDAIQREALAERRRDEERLRLASVLEATRAGAWEWNLQTGDVHFNAQYAEILGRTLEELAASRSLTLRDLGPDGRCVRPELMHEDDWPGVVRNLRQYLRHERDAFDCDARMQHKDGHWVWVHTSGRITHWTADGEPLLMYGTLLDISGRKAVEQKLHESEAFLDRAGRIAGVGGWQLDLRNNELVWSDQTCIIHDLPVGYVPTLDEALAFFDADRRAEIEDSVRRAAADGKGWDLELPMTTARKRRIQVRMVGTVEFEDGEPVRLIGALQDVTVRNRAVQALQVSERRFRRLFEESLGLICTHDLHGVLLAVNPAAADALGYPIAELLGRRLSEFMPAEMQPFFDAYLAEVARNGSATGLLRLVAKDGTHRTWQYHNTLDEEGDEPQVLGHALDITERERHERQLRDWSIRDALTGCFNRRYLAEVADTIARDEPWGCVAIDLDRFKQVNDTYGHQRGDEVLVAMAAFLKRHVRKQDIVVRAGGDEFLLLLPRADEAQTQEIVKRIEADRAQAPIGFTLGQAVRRDDATLDEALARADRELYAIRAKRPAVAR